MAKQHHLFLLFLLFAISNVGGSHFPQNYRFVYDYEAVVRSETGNDKTFVSAYTMKATLVKTGYIDKDSPYFIVRLRNVTYSMYNGEDVGIYAQSTRIPKESEAIEKPFLVSYGGTDFLTEKDDELWSINMKAAITSTLHFDVNQINENSEQLQTYSAEERTVYGNCNVSYTVLPQGKNRHIVKKHINPTKCIGFDWEKRLNIDVHNCKSPRQSYPLISSDRYYEVEKSKERSFIIEANTTNNILLAPFKGNADVFSVLVRQSLKNVRIEDIPDLKTEDINFSSMKPQLIQQPTYGVVHDLTGGRAKYDTENTVNEAMVALENVVKYFQLTQNRFADSITEKTYKPYIFLLLSKMRQLDDELLEKCFVYLSSKKVDDGESIDDLSQQSLTLFLEILPHIGTPASHILIKNLIVDKRIDTETALDVLKRFAFNAKFIDIDTVYKFRTIFDKENEEVKTVAKLSLCILVSKIVEKNPEDKKAQAIIDDLIRLFLKSVEYSDRLINLSALTNIRTKKVIKFLEQVIANNKQISRENSHLRSIAVFRLSSEYQNHAEHLDKILWPLFENKTEDWEVRIACMNVLMSNPANLAKMHWFMLTETDDQLYASYYTLLRYLSELSTPCYESKAQSYKRILKVTKKKPSNDARSVEFVWDYYDKKFGMGNGVKLTIFANTSSDHVNHHLSLYVETSTHMENVDARTHGMYVYVDYESKLGLAKTVNDYYSKIFNKVAKSDKVEMITLYDDQITSVSFDNRINYFDWNSMVNDPKVYYKIPNYPSGDYVVATDLGVPVSAFLHLPTLWKYKRTVIEEKDNLKVEFLGSLDHVYGLMVYNPLANAWHGTKRTHAMNGYVPINMEYNQTHPDYNTMNIYHAKKGTIQQFGLQTYAYSSVFIREGKERRLKETCSTCKIQEVVKMKELQTKKVWEMKCPHTGMKYKLEFYDCEKDVMASKLVEMQKFVEESKKWDNLETLKWLYILSGTGGYGTLTPVKGMCGLRFLISPQQTQTAISIGDMAQKGHIAEAGKDILTNDTINGLIVEMYKDDKLTNWWGLKADSKYGTDITRIKNYFYINHQDGEKEDFKLCVEVNEADGGKEIVSYAGYSEDNDNCPKDQTYVKVLMNLSRLSQPPKAFPLIKRKCKDKDNLWECIVTYGYPKIFKYNVVYNNVSSKLENAFETFSDIIYEKYSDKIKELDEDEVNEVSLDDNEFEVGFRYILTKKSVHLNITTSSQSINYKFIPTTGSDWVSFLLDAKYKLYTKLGITPCAVSMYSVRKTSSLEVENELSDTWMRFAGSNCTEDYCDWEILLRANQDTDKPSLRIRALEDLVEADIQDDGTLDYSYTFPEESQSNEYFMDLKEYQKQKTYAVYFPSSETIAVVKLVGDAFEIYVPNEYFVGNCEV